MPSSRAPAYPTLRYPPNSSTPAQATQAHLGQLQVVHSFGVDAGAVALGLRAEAVTQVGAQDGLGEAREILDIAAVGGEGSGGRKCSFTTLQ